MRVAALYDIHGNLPALDAVLAEVLRDHLDMIVVGGDVVPGPLSRETLEALHRVPLPVLFLRGNGETDVLAAARGEMPARVPEAAQETVAWVARAMTDQQLAAMEAWPDTVSLDVDGLGPVLFCHATPGDDNAIFTRVTPEERLLPHFAGVGQSVVVCGHTHMQFRRTVGDTVVVNAGSVGMPFQPPGAYWAVLEEEGVSFRYTLYDLAAAQALLAAAGMPEVTAFDVTQPPDGEAMIQVFEEAAAR